MRWSLNRAVLVAVLCDDRPNSSEDLRTGVECPLIHTALRSYGDDLLERHCALSYAWGTQVRLKQHLSIVKTLRLQSILSLRCGTFGIPWGLGEFGLMPSVSIKLTIKKRAKSKANGKSLFIYTANYHLPWETNQRFGSCLSYVRGLTTRDSEVTQLARFIFYMPYTLSSIRRANYFLFLLFTLFFSFSHSYTCFKCSTS